VRETAYATYETVMAVTYAGWKESGTNAPPSPPRQEKPHGYRTPSYVTGLDWLPLAPRPANVAVFRCHRIPQPPPAPIPLPWHLQNPDGPPCEAGQPVATLKGHHMHNLILMPADAYHAHPAIGSTTAKNALKSLRLLKDTLDGIHRVADRPTFQLGRLCHQMVLEPDQFANCVVSQGPINPKTNAAYGRDTKAWAEWQDANPGLTVVDPWILRMLDRMPPEVQAVLAEPGISEGSAFAHIEDAFGAKCRPDRFTDAGEIYDLKTIDDLDQVDRAITRCSYWFSAGWYRRVMCELTGEKPPFMFIFAEKSAPHRWEIVTLDDDYLAFADAKVEQTIEQICNAYGSGDWSDGRPVRRVSFMPEWIDTVTVGEDGSVSL
jgi:hypothetical protein